ncbi:MAG TPA: Xaa-Pro aminopeptidase [Patescibacteria group bacterium]|nr:Xaa-Pro aminopeptidase [Patescibacteria group bacterium]
MKPVKPTFSADFFAGNRLALRQALASDVPIVLTGNGLLQRNADNNFPFRQDSSFWYFTGIDIQDAILVIDGSKEFIILPKRQRHQEVFDGLHDLDELRKRSGITDWLDETEGWQQLHAAVAKRNTIAMLKPAPGYIKFYSMYSNPARQRLLQRLRRRHSGLKIEDLRQKVAHLRMIKQPVEIAAIQRAVDITLESLADVKSKFLAYDYEYEIEADLTQGFIRRGAMEQSFTPMVAGGMNACVIHHMSNTSPVNDVRFVLFDIGVEYEHYASDISDTVWRVPRNSREEAVYQVLLEARDYAFSLLKPGVVFREYEKQCETFMGEQLRKLGLISELEREPIRHYFPHRMSHHVGLDPHDSEDYDHPLSAGAVVAVEPGIYIPEEGIGVRIEDDVLLTKTGVQNLSAKLSR